MKWNYRLLDSITKWLEARGRRRMITQERDGHNEDCLERFYILRTKWLGIYLHRFWASDDNGLHDHPWYSASVLLAGSYIEHVPNIKSRPELVGPTRICVRKPMHPLVTLRSKHAAHRIVVPDGTEGQCWSLFIRFGFKKRLWGFYRDGYWVEALEQTE